MADLYTINAVYRARLLARDAKAAAEIADAYESAYLQLKSELAKALNDLDADPASVAFRVSRLRVLEDQLVEELAKFAAIANGTVTESQSQAVQLAVDGQREMLTATLTPAPSGIRIEALFNQLPKEAMEAFVGLSTDGSPLAALFADIAPGAAEAVRDRLLGALALGQGPDKVAAALADELGVPLTRALRISRTEMMRAYNEGSRAYLRENSEFIKGWYWMAAVGSTRTCSVCYAMHGSFHTLDETLASHTNCRCSMVLAAKSWAEMGYPGEEDRTWKPTETGEAAFGKLSGMEQKAILGKGKYELYKAGELRLPDLVEEGRDERWGPYRVEKPLWMVR